MAKPINSSNAIDSAVFILGFARPFNSNEFDALSGLQIALKDDLPSFVRNQIVKMAFQEGKQSVADFELAGSVLQRFNTDGKPAWTLRVLEDSITVTCHSYISGSSERNQAVKYLEQCVNLLKQRSDILLSVITLQITDVFKDTFESYSIKNVFNENSRYLTRNVFEAGALWHVFQGWFENRDNDSRWLHVLNLSTQQSVEHITSIDHAIQLQLREPIRLAEDSLLNTVQTAFAEAHTKNLNIIRNLLNDTQLNAIGLN